MRVHVDISVFTAESGSFGVVSGFLDMPIAPFVGDVVSFSSPKTGVLFPADTLFQGGLHVTDRVISVNMNEDSVMVCLEDLNLRTDADASDCVAYFQKGFGFGFDPSHG